MEDHDELMKKKGEIDQLIIKTRQLKEQIISLQIKARSQIYLLTALSPVYPESVETPRRLQICDDTLNKGTEQLIEIATQLTCYQDQIRRIDRLLDQSEPPNPTSSALEMR
jgi:hypothetical protein